MTDFLRSMVIDAMTRLLRERTGQALSEDRRWRIDTAVEGILRKRGIATSQELIVLLTQPNRTEIERELVEAMLNNETYFFRDRHVFDQLANSVLPQLAQARADTRTLSIWSAGCSTGQEALSLAMLLLDQPERWAGWKIDILATDVSSSAVASASAATYSQFEIQRGLAVGQMLKHFEETAAGWRASPHLRRMVRFVQHNLLDGPPPGICFDLILCRNVLLYFHPDARRQALRNITDSMAPHARLLLGGGETVLDYADLLVPVTSDSGHYRLAHSFDRSPAQVAV